MWSLAALMWVPWFAILVTLVIDSLLHGDFLGSIYFVPALVGISPQFHWLGPWVIHSWWVIGAVVSCGLVAAGWRIYWFDQDGILTRSRKVIVLTIIIPALAPLVMYKDAVRRHTRAETKLEADVDEARQRLEQTKAQQ